MKKIKNLIFDFGGVLYDIDVQGALGQFKKIGFEPEKMFGSFSETIAKLETGSISDGEFLDYLLSQAKKGTDRSTVRDIFMKVLKDINLQSYKFLLSCRKNYNLYLLSNTSEMHYNYFHDQIISNPATAEFYNCFIKEYYSFRLGIKKPDLKIYEYVIADSGIDPGVTLFIDDNEENVLAARRCGLHAFNFGKEGNFVDLERAYNLLTK